MLINPQSHESPLSWGKRGAGGEFRERRGGCYIPSALPKLTLSFSLSCPAIEGDDLTSPPLRAAVYELLRLAI